jgi:Protein of unknown function (DUF2474)
MFSAEKFAPAPDTIEYFTMAGGSFKLWLSRIGWLVLIWSVSVAALGIAAFALRLLMSTAGFTT